MEGNVEEVAVGYVAGNQIGLGGGYYVRIDGYGNEYAYSKHSGRIGR